MIEPLYFNDRADNRTGAKDYFYYCPHCKVNIMVDQWLVYDLKTHQPVAACPYCEKEMTQEPGYLLHMPSSHPYYLFDYANLRVKGLTVDEAANYRRDNLLASYRTYQRDETELYRTRTSIFSALARRRYSMLAYGYVTGLVKKTAPRETEAGAEPDSKAAERIKSDHTLLCKYIKSLVDIETELHSLSERIFSLTYLTCHTADVLRSRSIAPYIETIQQKVVLRERLKLDLGGSKKSEEYVAPEKPEKPLPPAPPEKPELETPGFLNASKVKRQNAAIMEKYNAEMAAYERNKAIYERELKEKYEPAYSRYINELRSAMEEDLKRTADKLDAVRKEIAFCIEQAARNPVKDQDAPDLAVSKELVSDELSRAVDTYYKLVEGRNRLYSVNVVFPKYRNLIALSSFYEYLMSGRCASLEGANGAYNLYESEIRSNQVISQLGKVLGSLEQIKANQYMAYTQLTAVNNNLESLNTAMVSALNTIGSRMDAAETMFLASSDSSARLLEEIRTSSEVAAYNTAASAYYSKKNATLSTTMLFLESIR